MYCRDCPRYDEDAGKCRDGKLNPESWGDAVQIANVMGLRPICAFNDFRESLIRSRMSQTPSAPSRPAR